jgi:hypothetical protein
LCPGPRPSPYQLLQEHYQIRAWRDAARPFRGVVSVSRSGIGVTVGAGRARPSRLGGPAPKPPNNWASIKPIVAAPFWRIHDAKEPLPNFASAPGDLVACCQPGRRGLQHHSSGWSEGAWRYKHQRRVLQLLLLQ